MNAKDDPKTGDETIPLFTKMCFDYAELPLAQTMDLSAQRFGTLMERIKDGIPLESCNNFFPARIRLTGEDAKPDAALEYAKAAADRAAEMGAKIIVLGSSGAKNIPPGFPYNSAMLQLKELLFKIDEIIRPLGITVVIEPLNKKESNFITTASEGLSLVRELNLENIKLLIDYYHLRMEDEDPAVIIKKAGADLRHLHIASKEGRLFPKQGDGENYGLFFSLLKNIGYDGRVSIEAYSADIAADGADSLKLLHSLCC